MRVIESRSRLLCEADFLVPTIALTTFRLTPVKKEPGFSGTEDCGGLFGQAPQPSPEV